MEWVGFALLIMRYSVAPRAVLTGRNTDAVTRGAEQYPVADELRDALDRRPDGVALSV